jgi:putative addiction module component (TIGR02574 family)
MGVERTLSAGYNSAMSLAEILAEIPRLTSVERRRLAAKLFEFEGDWNDGDDPLSPEEKHLLESRLASHDRDPSSAVPSEEAKARLLARFAQ